MAKSKAPETVRVRASVAVYVFTKDQEDLVPLTPLIETLIADGKLVRLDAPIAAAAGRPMTDAEVAAAGGELDDGDDQL